MTFPERLAMMCVILGWYSLVVFCMRIGLSEGGRDLTRADKVFCYVLGVPASLMSGFFAMLVFIFIGWVLGF